MPVSSKMKSSSGTTIAESALMQGHHGARTTTGNKSSTTISISPSLGAGFAAICYSAFTLCLNFRNFEQGVFAGYRRLSNHYQPGDKIFLFGMLPLSRTSTKYADSLCLKGFLVAPTK